MSGGLSEESLAILDMLVSQIAEDNELNEGQKANLRQDALIEIEDVAHKWWNRKAAKWSARPRDTQGEEG